MRDRIGLAFFTFAAVISALAASEHPALLGWLAAVHNGILAALYVHRKPAGRYDRLGLGLGLLAAMLPLATTYTVEMPAYLLFIGALGYVLIFWSLLSLGNRFGIAPADRGLIVRGPYRWVRHPMYLGELILRAALVAASNEPGIAIVLLITLATVQVMRALREENIIAGYATYSSLVTFRLVPGVW